ncbi:MAG TPA: hypothetical protein P5069_17355, partial [Candidatus Hydrogenedentes bacterium]|nr:hypothetical protein [Candidatus Hydrogenedentota bacterium]
NRWGEVERLLKDALEADSGNRFAREMLKHLYSVRNTSRQIRGFMHDLNNRTANLAALAGRLADMAAGVAGAGEIRAQIALETENIASITRLVNLEGEGMVAPPSKQQECRDVADVLRDAGTSAGFPSVEIRTSGNPVLWGMWPALVRVAAINLLDNAREAHARKNLPLAGAPAWFEVDYDRKTVRCVDRAGGVAPGLRNALFEPYVSEKTVQVNVGLGLPQARLAMRAQRFDLRLDENQPPEGAAFVLDFNVPQPKGMPR